VSGRHGCGLTPQLGALILDTLKPWKEAGDMHRPEVNHVGNDKPAAPGDLR
jgi:hypothetical protein